jgi:hypothetical protein
LDQTKFNLILGFELKVEKAEKLPIFGKKSKKIGSKSDVIFYCRKLEKTKF